MKAIFPSLLITALWSCAAAAQSGPNLKTTSEVYSDWELVCVEQSDQKTCQAKQTILNEQKAMVSVIEVAETDAGAMIVQIALPHMLDLSKSPKMVIDQQAEFDAPYKFCSPQACFIILEDASILDAFAEGNSGIITAPTLNGSAFEIGFSLLGFKAAYESLSAQQ